MNRDTADISLKTSMPGPNAKALVDEDKKYQAKTTDVYPFVRAFDGWAEGPFCTDIDGNLLLDFTGQIGCIPLGYNHPEIIEVIAKVPPISPRKYAGTDFYGAWLNRLPSPTDLKRKLVESTSMFGFEKAGLWNSGAEAVENAIKACYAKRGRGYGTGFYGAFHGRTLGALSLNKSRLNHKQSYPEIPNIITIPYCCEDEADDCDCGFWVFDKKQGARMSRLEQLLNKKTGIIAPEEMVYILLEPVQGEGGYIVPNANFMEELKRVTSVYNIPLIADEVQAGLGRTGKLWAIEHWGIKPDLICSAKGLQVGATIGRADMFPAEAGRLSSTWGGGDIVGSIEGYKTLEIIIRDRLWENAEKMGDYFLDKLRGLQTRYSFITDVRGLGLMDAIEFDTVERRQRFEIECFKRGFMVLGCGYKALRFLPPLDVRKRELDIALNVTEDALKAI